ncbi:uncharacterized protein [Antedon mediterranea]|uniref:uncharacterized protein n=1 Tax=Antedon mediterranea TaxID=105859 RepID=UPI003AF852BD
MSSEKYQDPSAQTNPGYPVVTNPPPAYQPPQGYPAGQPAYPPQPQPAGYTAYNVQPVPVTTITTIRTRPNNYLISAILVTFFCCCPFGLIGIIYSVDSSSKFDSGDDAGAASSAGTAKSWTIAGLVCGIIGITIYVIMIIIGASTTSSYSSSY